MTDLEDIMIPAIIGLIVGPSGFFFLFQIIGGLDFTTWTFTMHDLAASITPAIPWLWLVNCIFVAGYKFWETR